MYTYDSNGDRLTATVDPGGLNLTTQFDYDSVGNVRHKTDPLGRIATFVYDSMRHVTQRTAPGPLNYVWNYGYDANGNPTEVDKQTGDLFTPWQTWRFTYSLTDQEQTRMSPLGRVATRQYDPDDRLSAITDAENHTTQYRYDALGRNDQVIDALGNVGEEHRYTPNGKTLSVKDAKGNVTGYEYDGLDRPSKVIYPDGSYEQYTYDAASRLLQKRTRGGQVIAFAYDNLDRLRTNTLPGATVQYTYDLADNLVDLTDATGTTHHSYDGAGRLTSVTYPGARTVSYQYDAAGNRARLTYPDGYFVTYGYDALNRLTNVLANGTTSLAQYSYDALSRYHRHLRERYCGRL